MKKDCFSALGPWLVKAEPMKILPLGGDFHRANPKGRRALTRHGQGATFAVFFIFD